MEKAENDQTKIAHKKEDNDKRIDSQLQDEPMSNPSPKPMEKRNVQKKISQHRTTKDIESFIERVSNESRGVVLSLHDFVGGGWKDQLQPKIREEELKKIRRLKEQNKKIEISR